MKTSWQKTVQILCADGAAAGEIPSDGEEPDKALIAQKIP